MTRAPTVNHLWAGRGEQTLYGEIDRSNRAQIISPDGFDTHTQTETQVRVAGQSEEKRGRERMSGRERARLREK